MTPPEPFEPTAETLEDVEHFVDRALSAQSWHTGETFIFCRLCGEYDSHADGCPIPAVLAWQEAPPTPIAPPGRRVAPGVEVGCGSADCQHCYTPTTP